MRLRKVRRELDPRRRQRDTARLNQHLQRVAEPRRGVAGLYRSHGAEVEVVAFSRWWRARGGQVAYPRVAGERHLCWHLTDETSQWVVGFRGLLEPSPGRPVVAASELALLVVPGLGFDIGGGRLGQGGGFYDGVIADLGQDTLVIGVGLSHQVIAAVPMASYDRLVDAVVTDLGVARGGAWTTA